MKTLSYFNLGAEDIEIVDVKSRSKIEAISSKLDSIPQDLDTQLSKIDNTLSTKVSISYNLNTKNIKFKE